MQIKDFTTPLPHIYLSDEYGGSQSRTLLLYVNKPAVGALAESYIPLNGSLHLEQWTTRLTTEAIAPSTFSTTARSQEVLILNSSIHSDKPSDAKFVLSFSGFNLGRATWRVPSSYFGEVRYTSNYWEWAEDVIGRHEAILAEAGVLHGVYASRFSYDRCDNVLRAFCKYWCPSTNTLHTPIGELSISLWDLHRLGGLPIRGTFYDEVVPSAKELSDVDDKGRPLLPRSCKHLFMAYYRLAKEDHGRVLLKSWVQFWFRGDARYGTPPARGHRRNTPAKPRRTFNPSGSVESSHLTEAKDSHVPFDILNIDESSRRETYVGAFLTCWICKFLLPSKEVDYIRLSVFKVASLMATGVKFSLAVPVLASIYDGLRKIV